MMLMRPVRSANRRHPLQRRLGQRLLLRGQRPNPIAIFDDALIPKAVERADDRAATFADEFAPGIDGAARRVLHRLEQALVIAIARLAPTDEIEGAAGS